MLRNALRIAVELIVFLNALYSFVLIVLNIPRLQDCIFSLASSRACSIYKQQVENVVCHYVTFQFPAGNATSELFSLFVYRFI